MKTKPGPLFFDTHERHEGGYTKTVIRITGGEERLIVDLMAGCVDNRAGYGTAEAAAAMLRNYSAAHSAGFVGEVHTTWAPWVELRWQHYPGPEGDSNVDPNGPQQYCQARIDLPTDIPGAKRAMQLLQRIETANRRISPYDIFGEPATTLATLAKMRATPIYRLCARTGHFSCYATLPPGKPLPEGLANGEYTLSLSPSREYTLNA